jgi:hypothetical protein
MGKNVTVCAFSEDAGNYFKFLYAHGEYELISKYAIRK